MKPFRFAAFISATLVLLAGTVQAEILLNIATVNNADMTIMRGLSQRFEEDNPDIKLDWMERHPLADASRGQPVIH